MYGVTKDLDLSVFRGATLIQVGVGQYQLQFHFDPTATLSVESQWSLVDANGHEIDRQMEHADRDCYRLHLLLGTEVTTAEAHPPDSISLRFSNGYTLRVFDDGPQYESFQIEPGGIIV